MREIRGVLEKNWAENGTLENSAGILTQVITGDFFLLLAACPTRHTSCT